MKLKDLNGALIFAAPVSAVYAGSCNDQDKVDFSKAELGSELLKLEIDSSKTIDTVKGKILENLKKVNKNGIHTIYTDDETNKVTKSFLFEITFNENKVEKNGDNIITGQNDVDTDESKMYILATAGKNNEKGTISIIVKEKGKVDKDYKYKKEEEKKEDGK